eukprot:TRINITY_DN82_c0_g1_i1.p2 TRINITY_DN82_c0_g1~~TRINITY_DN82_c0_g1_i1.p2  ORF type:complete len:101 (+),score=15.67 TRINITY_DN82_c0_g1_i1:275-577(+)
MKTQVLLVAVFILISCIYAFDQKEVINAKQTVERLPQNHFNQKRNNIGKTQPENINGRPNMLHPKYQVLKAPGKDAYHADRLKLVSERLQKMKENQENKD